MLENGKACALRNNALAIQICPEVWETAVLVRSFSQLPTPPERFPLQGIALPQKSAFTVGHGQYRNAVASGQLGITDFRGNIHIYVQPDATTLRH